MKSHVLIIEDDQSVRDSLKKVLEESGYAVAAAADGLEGAACLKRLHPDLMLLDLNLPKLTGFEILDLVRERHAGLPVIVLTGLADQCEPGALAGASALLEKPVDVKVLLEVIKVLLDGAGKPGSLNSHGAPWGIGAAHPAQRSLNHPAWPSSKLTRRLLGS